MKKPLSYFVYFKGNVKKTLSLIITIAFSILLIGNNHMFIANSLETGSKVITQFEKFTFIDGYEEVVPIEFLDKLEDNEDIERIIPVDISIVEYRGVTIASYGTNYYANREDIVYLLNLLDINYETNNIPLNDSKQIILNDNLIKNNEYEIGDIIGEEKDLELTNRFKSNYLVGFIPKTMGETNTKYLVIPRENKLDEVNKFISSNVPNNIKIVDNKQLDDTIDVVMGDVKNLFDIITIIILLSVGIGLGISSYVHYFQRRKEFGTLNSLGYSHKKILKRINKEILLTSLISLIIGLLLLSVEMYLMNQMFLLKLGLPPFKIDIEMFTRIIIIPLFTAVFSLVPTWVLLKKVDSVSIIEGES